MMFSWVEKMEKVIERSGAVTKSGPFPLYKWKRIFRTKKSIAAMEKVYKE